MGLPYWLPTKHPKMRYRASDPWFEYYVQRWYKVMMPLVVPLLYENGGPVIMAQVANEYGSFAYGHGCDAAYLIWLRDLIRSYLGPDFILFTVDGPSEKLVSCGRIDTVYTTVDFGLASSKDVLSNFKVQRLFQPNGPLVNTEFYPGWFDTWGNPHAGNDLNGTINTLESMFKLNASVNIYMYHGGTSFGFMNGAYIDSGNFRAMVTSYDYR